MRLQKQFFRFMKKRHAIYLARKAGKEPPWTTNSILRERMFCNVYRELDWTTDFMRKNITKPNEAAPPDLMLFNCAYFRYIGDSALFGHGGLQRFIEDFPSVRASLKQKIRRALDDGMKVFTPAYQIVHSGKSTPKEVYVVDIVLASLWEHRKLVAQIGVQSNSLQETFKALFKLRGFGGTGFMAYEVVTDLRWTKFYKQVPVDIRTWANAGPGTIRGLNRILGRPVKQSMRQQEANPLMLELLATADNGTWPNDQEYPRLEMRDIEHVLCDFNKFVRFRNHEGSIRRYRPRQQ